MGDVRVVKKEGQVWRASLSGAGSGAASTLLLQPLDLVKTRLQQRPSVRGSAGPSAVAASHTEFGGRGPPQNENQGARPPPKSKVRGR